MKKACASASEPSVPTPRTPASPQHRADRTTSEHKLPPRPVSAHVKRGGGAVRGAGGSDQRPRKPTSPQSSGDAELNSTWRKEMRRGTHALRDVRNHLADLHQKALAGDWGPEEVRAATARAAQLLREAERLQRRVQELQPSTTEQALRSPEREALPEKECPPGYQPGDAYEPPLMHELRMLPPSSLLAPRLHRPPSGGPGSLRSKSELELSRRLSESLDMQERLAADNADLDVKSTLCQSRGDFKMMSQKEEPSCSLEINIENLDITENPEEEDVIRSFHNDDDISMNHQLVDLCIQIENMDSRQNRYILYKELMVKEQRLETARAQAARLQAELKLLARDNARLQAAVNAQPTSDTAQNPEPPDTDTAANTEPGETYADLVKQLSELEEELRVVREMATTKHAGGPCGGQPCSSAGGPNICYEQQPGMPPMPPTQRDCNKCPPCPASCNPDAPLTPAEKEVIQLKEKLEKSEHECKKYIAECALLRSEVLKRKDEAEHERCVARETKARLRKLEMKFEGLTPKTNMQGPPDKTFETELNVQNLRSMLREAHTEIDDQTKLLTEMEKQLQDYRLKYLKSQQLAEEQTRQISTLDAENVRISEQINYEIQRVKIKFQEKLQELQPLPKLLQATHNQLRDAQQQQALAEHRTEQLARELVCARDKISVLEYELNKPVEKQPGADRVAEGKLLAATQQRVSQLADENNKFKDEVNRLRNSVVRLEEALISSGNRFQEKIDENIRVVAEQEIIKKEAERAIARANQRTETIRKCMQDNIAELERQLAASRAKVATADKERDELRLNMENQVLRLQDNCEMAHRRVRGLAAQIAMLRKVVPEVDTIPDSRQPCLCKDYMETLAPEKV